MWRRVQSRLNCMQRRKAVAFAVPYYCGMKTDLWCVGEPRVHSRSQLLPALLQSPALGCLPSALLLCPLSYLVKLLTTSAEALGLYAVVLCVLLPVLYKSQMPNSLLLFFSQNRHSYFM